MSSGESSRGSTEKEGDFATETADESASGSAKDGSVDSEKSDGVERKDGTNSENDNKSSNSIDSINSNSSSSINSSIDSEHQEQDGERGSEAEGAKEEQDSSPSADDEGSVSSSSGSDAESDNGSVGEQSLQHSRGSKLSETEVGAPIAREDDAVDDGDTTNSTINSESEGGDDQGNDARKRVDHVQEGARADEASGNGGGSDSETTHGRPREIDKTGSPPKTRQKTIDNDELVGGTVGEHEGDTDSSALSSRTSSEGSLGSSAPDEEDDRSNVLLASEGDEVAREGGYQRPTSSSSAATKIQRRVRSRQARVRKGRCERQRNLAAIRIQASARGRYVRRSTSSSRECKPIDDNQQNEESPCIDATREELVDIVGRHDDRYAEADVHREKDPGEDAADRRTQGRARQRQARRAKEKETRRGTRAGGCAQPSLLNDETVRLISKEGKHGTAGTEGREERRGQTEASRNKETCREKYRELPIDDASVENEAARRIQRGARRSRVRRELQEKRQSRRQVRRKEALTEDEAARRIQRRARGGRARHNRYDVGGNVRHGEEDTGRYEADGGVGNNENSSQKSPPRHLDAGMRSPKSPCSHRPLPSPSGWISPGKAAANAATAAARAAAKAAATAVRAAEVMADAAEAAEAAADAEEASLLAPPTAFHSPPPVAHGKHRHRSPERSVFWVTGEGDEREEDRQEQDESSSHDNRERQRDEGGGKERGRRVREAEGLKGAGRERGLGRSDGNGRGDEDEMIKKAQKQVSKSAGFFFFVSFPHARTS